MNTIKRISKHEEFNRNPELKGEDLQNLKDWCEKQSHLPKSICDNDLILFLHSNYYHLEATKIAIENYFMCKTHIPEFFANRNPFESKEIRTSIATVLVIPLEQKTKEGYGVIYSRLINFNAENFVFNDFIRLYNMISELWLIQNGTMKGHILVGDIFGVKMEHAIRISPINMMKFMFYLQEAIPFRIKGFHFINTTTVMDIILGIMKPFIKKELMDVIHLHPTFNNLEKYMSIDILPNEAGGKAGPMMNLYSKVLKNIEDHRNYFIEEEKFMRVNELLRMDKTKSKINFYGTDGSFKKLDID